jgi:hypothetical protein
VYLINKPPLYNHNNISTNKNAASLTPVSEWNIPPLPRRKRAGKTKKYNTRKKNTVMPTPPKLPKSLTQAAWKNIKSKNSAVPAVLAAVEVCYNAINWESFSHKEKGWGYDELKSYQSYLGKQIKGQYDPLKKQLDALRKCADNDAKEYKIGSGKADSKDAKKINDAADKLETEVGTFISELRAEYKVFLNKIDAAFSNLQRGAVQRERMRDTLLLMTQEFKAIVGDIKSANTAAKVGRAKNDLIEFKNKVAANQARWEREKTRADMPELSTAKEYPDILGEIGKRYVIYRSTIIPLWGPLEKGINTITNLMEARVAEFEETADKWTRILNILDASVLKIRDSSAKLGHSVFTDDITAIARLDDRQDPKDEISRYASQLKGRLAVYNPSMDALNTSKDILAKFNKLVAGKVIPTDLKTRRDAAKEAMDDFQEKLSNYGSLLETARKDLDAFRKRVSGR